MNKTIKLRAAIGLLTIALGACSGDDGTTVELMEGFDPPAPAANQVQVVSPIIEDIAPGADVTLCTYLPAGAAFDETLDVIEALGYQSAVGSHHAVLYMAERERPVDTHECTDDDMVNARFLAGAGGGEAGGTVDRLPDGVAYRVEGDRQLMVQTHWINTTLGAIDGQVAFNLTVEAPTADRQLAQLFTWSRTQIEVPANGTGSAHTDCVVQKEMHFYLIGGHAHEHGTHVSLTHTPASGEPNMFYDEPWESYYTFDPPRVNYTADGAMVVMPGDTLSVDCQYDNDTDEDLTFPREMCTGFGFFFPGDAQADCSDGQWPEGF